MYSLYKENIDNEKHVSRTIYEREFRKMNLTFKRPQQDTCNLCDTLKMKIKIAEESKNLDDEKIFKSSLTEHHMQAELAYSRKREDKKAAKEEDSKVCFAFDLQQCLPTPNLNTSVAFYKRQLWTFNLTVHDLADGSSKHFMWHEGIAGRGADEIASCLYIHLKSLPHTIKCVTYYSDTCGGQNKNSFVAAMFLKAMKDLPNLDIVNHKFLVPGHTHMECDIDHAIIEKKKKSSNAEIFHPHDWYQLVRSCGKNNKFQVHELQRNEIFKFSDLLKSGSAFVSRKKDEDGNLFRWRNVKWLQYRKQVGKIFFKASLEEDDQFLCVSFNRRGKLSLRLTEKYLESAVISDEKKKDILSLLPLIPAVFHDFYKNLISKNMNNIDPDLESNSSSEEI